jgi:hypothetical protein
MSAAQPPKSPDNNSPDHDHAGVDMVDKDQYAWFFRNINALCHKQD